MADTRGIQLQGQSLKYSPPEDCRTCCNSEAGRNAGSGTEANCGNCLKYCPNRVSATKSQPVSASRTLATSGSGTIKRGYGTESRNQASASSTGWGRAIPAGTTGVTSATNSLANVIGLLDKSAKILSSRTSAFPSKLTAQPICSNNTFGSIEPQLSLGTSNKFLFRVGAGIGPTYVVGLALPVANTFLPVLGRYTSTGHAFKGMRILLNAAFPQSRPEDYWLFPYSAGGNNWWVHAWTAGNGPTSETRFEVLDSELKNLIPASLLGEVPLIQTWPGHDVALAESPSDSGGLALVKLNSIGFAEDSTPIVRPALEFLPISNPSHKTKVSDVQGWIPGVDPNLPREHIDRVKVAANWCPAFGLVVVVAWRVNYTLTEDPAPKGYSVTGQIIPPMKWRLRTLSARGEFLSDIREVTHPYGVPDLSLGCTNDYIIAAYPAGIELFLQIWPWGGISAAGVSTNTPNTHIVAQGADYYRPVVTTCSWNSESYFVIGWVQRDGFPSGMALPGFSCWKNPASPSPLWPAPVVLAQPACLLQGAGTVPPGLAIDLFSHCPSTLSLGATWYSDPVLVGSLMGPGPYGWLRLVVPVAVAP